MRRINTVWLRLLCSFVVLSLISTAAAALPSGGGGTPPTPPPPADPYVLVLVFADGDPPAAFDLEETGGLPTRFATIGDCNAKGTQWLSSASNPNGTVLKFNCIQVKPKTVTDGGSFLLDGKGGRLTASGQTDFLVAR